MGLQEECDRLDSTLNQVIDTLAELQSRAQSLLDCSHYELDREITCILENCYEGLKSLEASLGQIESIQSLIGNQSFLASIIFPTISLANASADSSIVTNIITDLNKNPLTYKTIPWLKILGDQGELTVWKMLLDSDGEDKLDWSEVEMKPKPPLKSNSGKDLNPDFYIKSCALICDAKAWCPADLDKGKKSSVELNIDALKETAKKYADAECLNRGGEVRLYFPEDTYNQQISLLEKLQSDVQSEFSHVKISMCPMRGVTYKDLIEKSKFRLTFLKWLGSSK
ncbi:hypothetical protein ACE1B6_16145 [Aerosakkonemataceae cyanobacterium BLCC-F154]|uniref:Uncharacterized protein n=1 Tax=Floridaenema fluviatile BLCC-F154 TaxID=3153640 RepID=A0ABV4YDN5_9CYAN